MEIAPPVIEHSHWQSSTAELPSDIEKLPAWFMSRMRLDRWNFGLMMTNGTVIAIKTITAVRQDAAGQLWLDVELLQGSELATDGHDFPIFTAPTGRVEASVAAAHVLAAFELAAPTWVQPTINGSSA